MGLALGLAAAGAGLGAANSYFTARRQDKEAARGIQEQSRLQREADARLQAELGEFEESDPERAKAEAMEGFMEQLRRTRGAAEGSVPTLAGASDRYSEDVAEDRGEAGDYAGRVAGLLARIDAPQTQRIQEGRSFGRLATDIGQIGRRSEGEDFLTRLRIRNQRNNPWVDALAGFTSNLGGHYATKPPAPPGPLGPPM